MTKNINIALKGINISHGYPVSSQPEVNVKEVQVINGVGPPDLIQHVETTFIYKLISRLLFSGRLCIYLEMYVYNTDYVGKCLI